MFRKKYLEFLGSKNAWQVLRHICLDMHLSFSITEMAKDTGVSKSNVYRVLNDLEETGLIKTIKAGKKKLYSLDTSSPFAMPIWEIVIAEKYMNLAPEVKNTVDLLTDKIKNHVYCLIVFGSVAQGLEKKWSDIDVCAILRNEKQKKGVRNAAKEFFPEQRVELHTYSLEEFKKITDFVIIDSLLHGIPLLGKEYVFAVKKDLKSFNKSYLLYRLANTKEIIKKAKQSSGEAKKYFEDIATISLGEINSLLERKQTIPKKMVKKVNLNDEIKKMEEILARKGNVIWLV